MAAQEGSATPSAQVVGNAFVEQYYHILHQSPGLVHRFYQDSSLLSRPDSTGTMATVTTMQVSLLRIKIIVLYTCACFDMKKHRGFGVICMMLLSTLHNPPPLGKWSICWMVVESSDTGCLIPSLHN